MRLFSSLAVFGLLFLISDRAAAADALKGTFSVKDKDGTEWAVTFDGKGKFSVSRDGKDALKGTVKITKEEVEFTDEEGDFASKGDEAKYTYKWKLAGKKLTLTKVTDANAAREAVITAGDWEKKD